MRLPRDWGEREAMEAMVAYAMNFCLFFIDINEWVLYNGILAKNPPKGDHQRQGAVRDRTQFLNPLTGKWTKRDVETGKILDVKADDCPFKGVRKE